MNRHMLKICPHLNCRAETMLATFLPLISDITFSACQVLQRVYCNGPIPPHLESDRIW